MDFLKKLKRLFLYAGVEKEEYNSLSALIKCTQKQFRPDKNRCFPNGSRSFSKTSSERA